MTIKEAKEIILKQGWKLLKEETYEKEYFDVLRTAILNKAKKENFNVDEDLLETLIFEAYDRNMDLETAKKKVWLAVYIDKNGTGEEIE